MSMTSKRFTSLNDLEQLDWQTINSNNWKNDGNDLRRQDKKQAELLVKNVVPLTCLVQIVTYNDFAYQEVRRLLDTEKQEIDIIVSQKDEEYYYDFVR